MSTPIENNTAGLQEILQQVNELPEGGAPGNAVLYTEQALTPEQQSQARQNIGASPVNIYTGPNEPTDENIQIWVNPDEEPENVPSKTVQTDWNQTDETAPDFLKNKPFEGKPTWDDIGSEDAVYYDEQNVNFTDVGVEFECSTIPTIGDTVTVVLDGATYESLVRDSGLGMLVCGDFGIPMGAPDGSAPFCIAFAIDSPMGIIYTADLSTHTIKITGRAVTKIPKVYVSTYSKFYLEQNNGYYLSKDAIGESRVTLAELNEAITSSPLIIDYGNTIIYSPICINLFAGEDYGSVTIMMESGKLKTYYTAEYTP